MQLGDQTARSDALQNVELSFAEPGDNGIPNASWTSSGRRVGRPVQRAGRPAPPSRPSSTRRARSPARSTTCTPSLTRRSARPQRPSTRDRRRRRRRSTRSRPRSPRRSTAIKQRRSRPATQPNDLYDRRDLLLDQLSTLGQVSVTDLGNGAIDVSFGDAPPSSTPTTRPAPRRSRPARPLTHDLARRQARRAARPAVETGGTIDVLPERPSTTSPRRSPTSVNASTTRAAPARTSSPTAPARRPAADRVQRAGRQRHEPEGRHRRPGRQLDRPRDRQPARRQRRPDLQAARDPHRQRGRATTARRGERRRS